MSDLKVGDRIAVNRKYGPGVDMCTVEKVTPTMYVTNSGLRFRRSDMRIVAADRFGPFSGRIPTEADILNHRVQVAQRKLQAFTVTTANVGRVEQLLSGGRSHDRPHDGCRDCGEAGDDQGHGVRCEKEGK